MPRILVVDDEANIRDLVSVYLTSAGFDVTTAEDGATALQAFVALSPDLIVLDLMLPAVDGPAVLEEVRSHSSVPVIVLTARSADLDKVSLLERGADDYLTKPFSPPELVARVRAVLRRTEGTAATPVDTGERLVVGGLVLDRATREASVDDRRLDLTTREFDLLAAMAARPGFVFTRDMLLETVAGSAEYADSRGVDVHVRHLREKLGDDATTPRFIETVRGVGYRVRKAQG